MPRFNFRRDLDPSLEARERLEREQRERNAPPSFEDALADFSGEVDRLTMGDLALLSAVWEGGRGDAHLDAVDEAEEALDTSGRRALSDELKAGIVRWAQHAGNIGTLRTYLAPPGLATEHDLRTNAMHAVYEAGLAILVQDVVDPTTVEELARPWNALMDEQDARDGEDEMAEVAEEGGEEGGEEAREPLNREPPAPGGAARWSDSHRVAPSSRWSRFRCQTAKTWQ